MRASREGNYEMQNGLINSFSDRIELSSWIFIFAGLTPLFITWLTVGLQTIKAARINPVHYLRNE
jgi:hypothetical protein